MHNKEQKSIYNRLIILCWITIICCFILKIAGFSGFDIPIIDSVINDFEFLKPILYGLLYCTNGILFTLLLVKRKLNFKEFLFVFIVNISLYIGLYFLAYTKFISFKIIIELVSYILIGKVLIKDKLYKILIESFLIIGLLTIYQAISLITKNLDVKIGGESFINSIVFQIDYYILIILTILHEFKMKGSYLYGRMVSKLVILTKRRCKEKSLQQNQKVLQQKEIGYSIYLVLLSLFQFVVVFGICYLIKNTIVNTLIIFISFIFMRKYFGISYHAKTILSCTTISVLIFTLATRISLPLYISILCNVLIGLLIAYILFIIAQNETNLKLLEKYKVNISMMDKDSIMIKFGLSEIEASMIYDYYHRENFETVEDIAERYHYNKMKIYRLLKKISSV